MNTKEVTRQLNIKPERVRELINQINEQIPDIHKIFNTELKNFDRR